MSFCVGADDSLPENILGVKTALAGGLAAAPTSNCITPTPSLLKLERKK